MSGETEKDVSAWTIDSLHQHLRELMDERDRRYEERFNASEEAVAQARTATEKRFEGVNEFRAALADQTATFVPRAESEAVMGRVTERIEGLAARLNRMDVWQGATTGQSQGMRMTVGAVAGILAAVASIVVVVNLVIALVT